MRNEGKNADSSEEKKRNKKKARTGEPNNNPPTQCTAKECKCGGDDHKQISSLRCPWRGLAKVEVARKYEKRMSKIIVPESCEENTVDPTTEPTLEATEKGKQESGDCKERVHSSSKYFGASSKNPK
jgi:hypothetical protein